MLGNDICAPKVKRPTHQGPLVAQSLAARLNIQRALRHLGAFHVEALSCFRRWAAFVYLQPCAVSVHLAGWLLARTKSSSQHVGSIPDACVDLLKICFRDAIRRHQVDRIAERPEQQISPHKLRTNVREIAWIAGFKIKRRDGSSAAYV